MILSTVMSELDSFLAESESEQPRTSLGSVAADAIKGKRGIRQQALARAGIELLERLLQQDNRPAVTLPTLAIGVTDASASRVRMNDTLRELLDGAERSDAAALESAIDDFCFHRIRELAANA